MKQMQKRANVRLRVLQDSVELRSHDGGHAHVIDDDVAQAPPGGRTHNAPGKWLLSSILCTDLGKNEKGAPILQDADDGHMAVVHTGDFHGELLDEIIAKLSLECLTINHWCPRPAPSEPRFADSIQIETLADP